MFIFNDKFHYCYGTFTNVLFILLLAKNSHLECKLFQILRSSISLAILSEISIQFRYCFLQLCKKTKVGFFLTHCVSNKQTQIQCYYRATSMHSEDYAVARRLSVTRRYWV